MKACVIYNSSGRNVEEVLFLNMKPSFVFHGYWRMTHMHLDGWFVKFEHRGLSLECFFLCGVNDICNGVQMCDQFSIFVYEIVKCENFIIEISFVNCFLSFVQNNSIFC